MRYWLYNMAITLAAPLVAGYLAASSRHRAAIARFYPNVPKMPASPIWIHACSVGEVAVAQPLLKALASQCQDIPLLLTTSTVTGHARAKALTDTHAIAWFPIDHPISVDHFLRQADPRLLILIETELWPNVLRLTSRQSIPVALVNGRISERHYHRYIRSGRMVRDMMSHIAVAGVQDKLYADRFVQLGIDRAAVQITGNLKFDGLPEPPNLTERNAFRTACGIPSDAPIIVFGSTRPGDERRAIDCWQQLRSECPELYLVIAPRHVERVPGIVRMFSEPVRLRTELGDGSSQSDHQAIIVNTHGELYDFYAIATLAVIGGSFDDSIQGHNPIEPAAMGVPLLMGPHMRNFSGAAELLVRSGAAAQISRSDQLQPELAALLRDRERRIAMGIRGRDAVTANCGALQRTIEMLDSNTLLPAQDCNAD
jgi:3-deoxy-D-manno-octulosonic-acid transferase